jgi:peptide deformylase
VTRAVLIWPDARLARPAEDVTAIDDTVRALWEEMIAVMDAMPGVGLAAVQLGEMRRLAVVDASPERGQAVRMANPEVVAASGETIDWTEASPCLPGVSARITRPRRVTVRHLGPDGAIVERDFEGLWAVSAQHQIDHLAGRMFFDRLSRTRRGMLLKKARKLVRAGG